MGIRQEEQIDRYFEHGMTAGEETNFLIALAASDEMRVAFRSQLELMKAVRDDKDALRSGLTTGSGDASLRAGSGLVEVRNRTLTALGLSAAAVTPFLEQELLRNERAAEAAQTSPQAASLGGSWASLRSPKYALGAGILLGFLGSIGLMNLWHGQPATAPRTIAPTTSTAVAPVASQGTTSTPSVATQPAETIPSANHLKTTAGAASAGSSEHAAAPVTTTDHPATTLRTTATKTPEVSVGGRGQIGVHPSIIKTTADTAK